MKNKILLGSVVMCMLGAVVWLDAQQNFITTESRGNWGSINNLSLGTIHWAAFSKDNVTVELKGGKLHVTHDTHDPCYAATFPACPGHGSMWRDVYASSNGVVVLERTINQVLVTRTNVTTTQTYEWPE